jgi:hypothetical protein
MGLPLLHSGEDDGLVTRSAIIWEYLKAVQEKREGEFLVRAAAIGDKAFTTLLFERGAEVNFKDKDGRTPLSFAAENRHVAVVRLLLMKGAEVNFEDESGQTPLWFAALNGHETIARLLLESGADVNFRDKGGRAALCLAAAEGHEAIVRLLLKNGAEVNFEDDRGWTPLSFAKHQRHWMVKELLLAFGAKVGSEYTRGYPFWLICTTIFYWGGSPHTRGAIISDLKEMILVIRWQTLLPFNEDKRQKAVVKSLFELWRLARILFNIFYSIFFFEWPDGLRLLSTTMPWNIPPSLLVLWGVCWMFAPYEQDIQGTMNIREGFIDMGLLPFLSPTQQMLRFHLSSRTN